MADDREEARFGAARGLRLLARLGKRPLGGDPARDVATDALHLDHAALAVAHGDFLPGDGAHALARHDLLVIALRSVGQECGRVIAPHLEDDVAPEDLVERPAQKRADAGARVGDTTVLVLTHDEVPLRVDQLRRVCQALLELPDAVVALVYVVLELVQAGVELTRLAMADGERREREHQEAGEHALEADLAGIEQLQALFLRQRRRGQEERRERRKDADVASPRCVGPNAPPPTVHRS